MIFPQQIHRADAERVALAGLRSFFDIAYVSKLLSDKHAVDAKNQHFVKLQAESIRYCLHQAIEYRNAALASTFSRPTLTYYSMMSLALCEILFKRDGSYSLAKLRQHHGHHGLDFSFDIPTALRGSVALTELSACVLKKGVFPVWYETARHPAIFGQYREIRQSGVTTALQTFGEPTPLETLPKPLTLLDLACSCPTLFYERADLGIQSRLARARLAVDYFQDRNLYILDLIIHPTAAELVDQIGKRIRFSARCADLVQPKEFYSGGGFRVEHPFDADYVDIEFPTSYTLHGEECLFTAEEAPLNEFGIYYMASYIAGMFARYYPEYWARGVEANDRTFRVVDALMSHALSRAPLLLLGELGNKYYVYFQ